MIRLEVQSRPSVQSTDDRGAIGVRGLCRFETELVISDTIERPHEDDDGYCSSSSQFAARLQRSLKIRVIDDKSPKQMRVGRHR